MIKAPRRVLPVLDTRHSATHDRKKCFNEVFAHWVSAFYLAPQKREIGGLLILECIVE
jgi:hypothetical protein